jgi:hypothetical protein
MLFPLHYFVVEEESMGKVEVILLSNVHGSAETFFVPQTLKTIAYATQVIYFCINLFSIILVMELLYP